jgi:SAM-dependent methyltransferase
LRFIKSTVQALGNKYNEKVCHKEYETQKWHINERPIEFRFVFEQLTNIMPTTVLDVGTGTTALPHMIYNCGFVVTAIDNIEDYWPNGMVNRHFYVINDNILDTKITKRFDFITCISVLEHIVDHRKAVRSLFSLLVPGGHLALTFPYNESNYLKNVYSLPESSYGKDLPYICQIYSRSQIDDWLSDSGGRIITQEYWEIFSGNYWTFGKHIPRPHQVDVNKKHHLTCVLVQGQ